MRTSNLDNSVAAAAEVPPAKIQAQLERILASSRFASAKSPTRFLRYVVEETLAGRGDRIKEYVVGTAVFHRGDTYDPRADAVVRVEATRLRNRLRDYYQHEGIADAISIELPKGSYVPQFQSLHTAEPAETQPRPLRRATIALIATITLVLTLGVAWWVASSLRPFPAVQSLAVLPFENLSGDHSQDYLADGLSEHLTRELGHLHSTRVLSYSAVSGYDYLSKRRPAMAGDLKVDAWVEGSVARRRDRLFVTERLIRSQTSRPLWFQSYESDLTELPKLQRESARGIAAAIGAEWPPRMRTAQEALLRIKPEAYDYYLRARFHSRHQTASENEIAIADLQRAVLIDPSFATAYADLAQSYVWRLFLFAPAGKDLEERAYVASERALSLDPDLAAAHVARPASLDFRQPFPSWKRHTRISSGTRF